jgi:hypothetical protein
MKRIDTRYFTKVENPTSRRALRASYDREGALLAREARESLDAREAREEARGE